MDGGVVPLMGRGNEFLRGTFDRFRARGRGLLKLSFLVWCLGGIIVISSILHQT